MEEGQALSSGKLRARKESRRQACGCFKLARILLRSFFKFSRAPPPSASYEKRRAPRLADVTFHLVTLTCFLLPNIKRSL